MEFESNISVCSVSIQHTQQAVRNHCHEYGIRLTIDVITGACKHRPVHHSDATTNLVLDLSRPRSHVCSATNLRFANQKR